MRRGLFIVIKRSRGVVIMDRTAGLEPALSESKSGVLPLDDTRIKWRKQELPTLKPLSSSLHLAGVPGPGPVQLPYGCHGWTRTTITSFRAKRPTARRHDNTGSHAWARTRDVTLTGSRFTTKLHGIIWRSYRDSDPIPLPDKET